MSLIDYRTVYESVRADLMDHVKRELAIRNWAVLLAGAVAILCIRALAYDDIPSDALIADRVTIATLIVLVGALVNLALWNVAFAVMRGGLDVAAYTLSVEKRAGRYDGWEHWIHYRHAAGVLSNRDVLLNDVQFVLALVYALGALALALVSLGGPPPQREIAVAATLGALVAFGVGWWRRLSVHSYRMAAVRTVPFGLKGSEVWESGIKRFYFPEDRP